MTSLESKPHGDTSDALHHNGMRDDMATQIVIPIGMTDDGIISVPMGETPAILVVGTTGSGKSSFVKAVAAEMMRLQDPQDLRLLICDSSRVEYGCFAVCPFLGAPVICDAVHVQRLMRWVVAESDRRIALLSQGKGANYPHLFVVFDDFVAFEPSEEMVSLLERVIQRARLVKVHIILVTSLPSSRSLSGGIMSNTDSRIAFRVTSRTDSIRAIGRPGANDLGVPGEMIIRGGNTYVRCKAKYMDDDYLRKLCVETCERYENEMGNYLPIWPPASDDISDKTMSDIDEALIDKATQIIVETRIGSTSALQRKLRVGYAVASRIMDELEVRGVVGPPNGSRPRDVLVDPL